MVRIAVFVAAVAALAASVSGQQCTGNASACPNGADGVSPTYLQCSGGQYVSQSCPSGQVCYANPNSPGTAMCGLPGTGGVPGQGKCTGNTAKCAAAGQTGAYYQCENWSGQYVNDNCPTGLKCYTAPNGVSVYCA
ncbi:hypothetical protein LPJ61_000063 [Coemansia biformis]|uniref:Carbohydrate-binding module family 19 domain-containing protein n=1 Tax=Coemansia biformis TaxID=1286918 RepID=A0A9W8D205_9FUNG|nr:hypothetical protein LPJ61_000063 [Coemansia biformis]